MKTLQFLLKVIQFFWYFPRRAYYASLSPEYQFTKLIRCIKDKKPRCYTSFEKILGKRFETIDHPDNNMHRFQIAVGDQKQICAYDEVDDWDEGLKWIILQGPEGKIRGHTFAVPYSDASFD